jgi:hypothetical protein
MDNPLHQLSAGTGNIVENTGKLTYLKPHLRFHAYIACGTESSGSWVAAVWKIKPASTRKREIPALPAHIRSHDHLYN